MIKLAARLTRPERIQNALFTTSALHFIGKGAGYLKNMAIAAFLGFSYKTDAFFFGLSIVSMFLVMAAPFDSVGLPGLVRAKQKDAEDFKQTTGRLLAFNLIIAALTALFCLAALPVIMRLGWGFPAESKTVFALTLWILFPAVILNFFYNQFSAMLRAQRLFTLQSTAELINSFSTFLLMSAGLFCFRQSANAIFVLPWAITISMALAVLWQFCFVRRQLHLDFKFNAQALNLIKQFALYAAMAMAGALFGVIDKAFASYLPEKSISALVYGMLITMVPVGIVRLESMFFTSISEKTSWPTLSKFILLCLAISLPYALMLCLFPRQIVDLIFGYGRFGALDADWTALAMRYYALALPAFYLSGIFNRIMAVKEYFSGIFLTLGLNLALNVLANYIFMFRLNMGLRGLVIATVIVAYVDLAARAGLVWSRR